MELLTPPGYLCRPSYVHLVTMHYCPVGGRYLGGMPTVKRKQDESRPDYVPLGMVPLSTLYAPASATVPEAAQAASKNRASKKRPLAGLRRRDPQVPLLLEVAWRNGSMPWIHWRARGKEGHLPGHWSIAEVVLYLNNQGYR